MARKTPQAMLALLNEHDATVAFWANAKEDVDGSPLSEDKRLGILIGLNTMAEMALHKHGCYHGFRYVKHVKAENKNSPSVVGAGWLLEWNTEADELHDQVRSYFRKF